MKVFLAILLCVASLPFIGCKRQVCNGCDVVVVVASTPAFSNVCKAVGASIRVLDLRNISQKDLIWITEEVDLILATRDFTREELERIAKAVSVECVNWDYEDVSPKGIEYLTSIIHKHREERRICAEILDRRSKMSDEERIAEYYALIEKEDCGPFEFKDALASDVFTGILQRINGHLRRRHSEYEFSGSYGVTGVEMVNDASITNRHYTLYIPRMPPLKMWQYVAEQLNCSITNRNGFIEMEQMFTPAEKVNPNIVNVTVPIPAMTNDAACFACESKPGDFTIYAAHYAKKGYCRFGMTGLGEFLEYSFGRTNYCDSTAFEVHEGTNKFMCVTNSIVHISKDFDVATLYHDAKSRRLFKASVSRSLPDSMSVADRIKFLNSISKAFDYMYRIKVPIPCAADVGALMKNNHGEWSIERGDDLFLLTLSLSVSDNKSIRVTMTVESKQVRHPVKRRPDDAKDVEVDVSDL